MTWRTAVWLAGMTALTAAGREPPPFGPLYYHPEPAAPMLADVSAGDVLREAKVTASHAEPGQPPAFANNGNHDYNILHWESRTLPAWLQFALPEARTVAQINLWIYAPALHTDTFTFTGSEDGEHWQTLVDRSHNTQPTTMHGFTFVLPKPVTLRWLRLNVLTNSQPGEGAMIFEVDAYARPTTRNLHGAVGDVQRHYGPADVPLAQPQKDWAATAWRGERVSGQFLVWTRAAREDLRAAVSELRTADGHALPAPAVQVRFVKQVLADGQLVGDVLDPAEGLEMPAGSYRAVWLTIAPPRDAVPGVYHGKLTVRADDTEPLVFPLTLEVLSATLPAPKDWAFHLDIWQHPWAIARWHDVKPWSPEHFRLMRPYLTELARAGQKVITTTITYRPWGRRDYDDYQTMVRHLREPDGSWSFDYTDFDRYVEFAMSCGITAQINCYSLLTWSSRLYYTDAATGDRRFMSDDTAGPEFAEYWAPFLQDFQKHLAEKGWLERTRLAVDEAPPPMMEALTKLVHAYAPKLRISLAGNQAPSHYAGLDLTDFSIILDHASPDLLGDLARFRAEGRTTTFYICLDPKRPNTFVASPPAEAVWLGYYASAAGFDGLLRWAYTNWPQNPLHDASYWGHPYHHYLPAGDAFLVYPGPRSSIRWEMLRDGIEEWEKLAMLRAAHGGKLPAELAARLAAFRDPTQLGDDANVRRDVEQMRAAVNAAARAGP